jgi:uncharacterized membrane protein
VSRPQREIYFVKKQSSRSVVWFTREVNRGIIDLKPDMQTSSIQSRRLRDYTNPLFEVFIAAFTILPFIVLAYFYQSLPGQVPLFLNLSGAVETWAAKSIVSVFRVPLLAVVTQVVCLLMKYGAVQSKTVAPIELAAEQTKLQEQLLSHNAGLWDWFRCAVAFKMSAESLDTIFLSIERFKFLARPTFIVSGIAATLGAAGALVYLYRLLVVRRKLASARIEDPVNVEHVYGGILYFNPSDSALFVSKYLLNFANKWVWVLIASIIAYPLLVFCPA